MRKTVFLTIAVAALVLSQAAFGQEEKPAGEQVQSQTTRPERPRERLQEMSAEERAKLKEKWQNMSEEEKAQYRAKLREQFGGGRPGPLAAQQQSALAEQIATLKQQHKLSVGELQSIRQLALKEKATQTAQALEKLIAKQEDEHQKRLKGLEQRLQRMQAARSGQTPDANAPSKPTDATRGQPGRQRQRPTTPRQQR